MKNYKPFQHVISSSTFSIAVLILALSYVKPSHGLLNRRRFSSTISTLRESVRHMQDSLRHPQDPLRHSEDPLRHPQGDAKYLFYLYDDQMKLVHKWLSLQQIQTLLLSHQIVYSTIVSGGKGQKREPPPVKPPGNALTAQSNSLIVVGDPVAPSVERPDVNVHGIVATVQKVMAEHMIGKNTTKSDINSESNLKDLLRRQYEKFIKKQPLSSSHHSFFNDDYDMNSLNTFSYLGETTEDIGHNEIDNFELEDNKLRNDLPLYTISSTDGIDNVVTNSPIQLELILPDLNKKKQEEKENNPNLLKTSDQMVEFTTFQNVNDIDSIETTEKTTQRNKPASDVSSSMNMYPHETIDMSFYYYDDGETHQSSYVLSPPVETEDDVFKVGESLKQDYVYYDGPVYLDEEIQDYYDKQQPTVPKDNLKSPPKTNISMLDFPNKKVAESYHSVEVTDKPIAKAPGVVPTAPTTTQSSVSSTLSGHQVLEQLGVSVRPKDNVLREAPPGNLGMESSIKNLSPKIKDFINTMNNVTFSIYKLAAQRHRSQNFVMSSFSILSVLWMLSLGARGSTADTISKLLQSDKFRNFNPHLLFKNIQNEILDSAMEDNIAFTTKIFVEEPRPNSIQSLDFYRRTVNAFYGSTADRVRWDASLGLSATENINKAVRNQTKGRVKSFLKENGSISLKPPFSFVSAALFQLGWKFDVSEADLFDMSFIRFPSAERRLVRTLGINKYMEGIYAGYSAEFEATLAEIPLAILGGDVSMIAVLPGQQKNFIANGLKQIENRLSTPMWNSLLHSMVPHSIKVQMPLFRHRSFTDVASLLKLIGLDDLLEKGKADFSGVNGVRSLHLADVIQLSEFHSCRLSNTSLPVGRGEELDSLTGGSRINYSRMGPHHKGQEINVDNVPAHRHERSTVPEDSGSFGEEQRKTLISTIWSFLSSSRQRNKPIEADKSKDERQTAENVAVKQLPNPFHAMDFRSETEQQKPKTTRKDSLEAISEVSDRIKLGFDFVSSEGRSNAKPTVAFDRAFMYLIRHNPTGLILHIGRYLEPN